MNTSASCYVKARRRIRPVGSRMGGPMSDPREGMGCSEIFGGNLAVDQDLQIPDLDIWVYSMPHGGANEGGDVVLLSRCGMGYVTKVFLGDDKYYRILDIMGMRHANAATTFDEMRALVKMWREIARG